MRYSIGYQLAEPGEESIVDLAAEYREQLVEIYFPWVGEPSGRAVLDERRGYVDFSAQSRIEEDLLRLSEMGIRLNLLLNANCYGEHAASEYLQNRVMSIIEHLGRVGVAPAVVTTASPAVAFILQRHAPQIDVRASANMKIGTPTAMQQVADLFGSFCLQREYNRDLDHIRRVRQWTREQGKGLTVLANSGCLAHCPSQTYHDNLVAHEAQADEIRPLPDWLSTNCRRLMRAPANWAMILKATWIRPEDVRHYEGLCDHIKLATRMHSRPRRVLDAYCRGRTFGNLADLFEPSFAPALAPQILDATRMPEDFFQRVSTCGRRCENCRYCDDLLERLVCPG